MLSLPPHVCNNGNALKLHITPQHMMHHVHQCLNRTPANLCYCCCRLTPVSSRSNGWERQTSRHGILEGVQHAWCSKGRQLRLRQQHPSHRHHPSLGIKALDLHLHLLLVGILQLLDLPWTWSEWRILSEQRSHTH